MHSLAFHTTAGTCRLLFPLGQGINYAQSIETISVRLLVQALVNSTVYPLASVTPDSTPFILTDPGTSGNIVARFWMGYGEVKVRAYSISMHV
jgi:hypothetical protein